MQVPFRKNAAALIVLALFLYCSDAPDLIFPEPGTTAVVSGRVLPARATTRLYLLTPGGTDSTGVDTVTEMFEFRNVPYGAYFLHATAAGFGTTEKGILVDRPVVGLADIKLTATPQLVYSVNPVDGTLIDSAFIYSHSSLITATALLITVYFNQVMDTASVRRALDLHPPMTGVTGSWNSGPGILTIAIPRNELDGDDTLSVTIDTAAADRYGHHFERSLTVSYPVARGLGTAVPSPLLLSSTTPDRNSRSVSASIDVVLQFDSLMNEASVENAFGIEPAATPRFLWEYSGGRHRVRISFAELLQLGTWYTVTLKAGWKTVDSTLTGSTFTFRFETERPAIKTITPENGATNVYPKDDIRISTNFITGKTDVLHALTIRPPVDSLVCTVNRTDIRITHPPFDSGTRYTVTLDSSLRIEGGGSIGRNTTFSFTTIPKPDSIPSGDTVAWTSRPNNGSTNVAINQSFSCTFGRKVDTAAIGQRLSMQPPVACYLTWSEGTRLDIVPMHYLKSGTVYTVVIDSGYQSIDSIGGKTVRWSFTTVPLQLLGLSPPHGMVNADRSIPLTFIFNLPVDTETLIDAISTTPPISGLIVDSMVSETPEFGTARWQYSISHTALLPDTTYTVSLDSTVTDLFGVRITGKTAFTFSTGD